MGLPVPELQEETGGAGGELKDPQFPAFARSEMAEIEMPI